MQRQGWRRYGLNAMHRTTHTLKRSARTDMYRSGESVTGVMSRRTLEGTRQGDDMAGPALTEAHTSNHALPHGARRHTSSFWVNRCEGPNHPLLRGGGGGEYERAGVTANEVTGWARRHVVAIGAGNHVFDASAAVDGVGT